MSASKNRYEMIGSTVVSGDNNMTDNRYTVTASDTPSALDQAINELVREIQQNRDELSQPDEMVAKAEELRQTGKSTPAPSNVMKTLGWLAGAGVAVTGVARAVEAIDQLITNR